MCDHPRATWIGKADGIYCGICGTKIEPDAPVPKQKEVPAEEKKAAPKKGGKK